MKRKIKIYPRDFQAEHIASEFPTYAFTAATPA